MAIVDTAESAVADDGRRECYVLVWFWCTLLLVVEFEPVETGKLFKNGDIDWTKSVRDQTQVKL